MPEDKNSSDAGIYREALAAGKPDARAMFGSFTEGGVVWADGQAEAVDTVIFATGIAGADGGEELIRAGAVIDASGTYGTPNPLGASGLPAIGERAAAASIFYGIPDALGVHRERYAGKRVLVAGADHSAFNALLDLAALADDVPDTAIIWVVRRASERMGQAYG